MDKSLRTQEKNNLHNLHTLFEKEERKSVGPLLVVWRNGSFFWTNRREGVKAVQGVQHMRYSHSICCRRWGARGVKQA